MANPPNAPNEFTGAVETGFDIDGNQLAGSESEWVVYTQGVERARIDVNGVGYGWANILGGSLPFVDVVGQYGADNTGSTESSTEWQAAIDDAHDGYLAGKGARALFASGHFVAIGLTLKSGCYVVGSGPGALKASEFPVSAFEPAATGTIFTVDDSVNTVDRAGILNLGFQHDRSFAAHAIDIAVTNACRWLTLRDLTFYNLLGSAVRSSGGFTLWESIFQGLHARVCGDGANGHAVIDLLEVAGKDTNNLTFRDLKVIYPQAVGFRALSSANPTSATAPGIRVVVLDNCMFHSGTSDSDLTAYDADMVVIDGFSDFDARGCNFAAGASGRRMLALQGTNMTQPSNRALLRGNRINGPVELSNVKDVDFGENIWTFTASGGSNPAYHVLIDSGVTGTRFHNRQRVVNESGPFVVSDSGAGTEYPVAPGLAGGAAFKNRTAGNVTVNSTTFAAVTSYISGAGAGDLDLVIKDAYVGQTILVGANGLWGNDATAGRLDFATIVSSSAVNYVSSAGSSPSANGINGMFGPASANTGFGDAVPYVVRSSDIATDGSVTIRPYAKADSGSKTLQAVAGSVLMFWARNQG